MARLAGLPQAVIDRAGVVLETVESDEKSSGATRLADDLPLFSAALARPAPAPEKPDPVRAALAEVDPDGMSPRDALEALYRLKGLAAEPL